ncbi:hypothetical protein LUW76_43360 [Actinomadura madurae]|uniref:hypothetical protein n=1 Tax=Actinomadura madurae TaxID=1993 RepID=UPI0020269938|nr:hypothetical protein [Actinomadura madurae]URN00597.1 hypothetical protein LUW76_43360 [Actinomadura madurae]URN02751.1 hypothetical protein LUW74_04845 [Actinomadura madurae]
MNERDRPRPVFDPAIGGEERALLAAAPERLVPACMPAPPPPRLRAATVVARLVWIPAFAIFYGVLPGGWLRVCFVASLDEDGLVGEASRWGRLPVLAMMLTPALQILLLLLGQAEAAVVLTAASFAGWALGALRHVREPAAARAAREHHGRYLLPGDFDRPAARLLVRAQRAVDAVLGSQSHGAGLLDDINNAVVLPRQEWAIAEALATHTRLRRERLAQQPERLSADVRALLEPQDRALALSVRSVTGRIEALEAYARRAGEADDAYHEARVLQGLPEQNARYRDLLASTVGDEMAGEEIRGMAEDARRAEMALRDRVAGAVRAGRELDPPPG